MITRVTHRAPRILVAHDVEETRDGIEQLLSSDGYQVDAARDEDDAVERARRRAPDLILVSLDYRPLELIARAARIRQRAHEIWEQEGRPEGAHERHWRQAESEVAAAEAGPAKKPAATRKPAAKAARPAAAQAARPATTKAVAAPKPAAEPKAAAKPKAPAKKG